MKSSIVKGTFELLLAGLPAVLALDLLYLYFVGSWYDPVKWIELTEVVVLAVVSLVYLGFFISKIMERFRQHNPPSSPPA
jgi:ABC-type polysaccharide/polyol phosphate export permease